VREIFLGYLKKQSLSTGTGNSLHPRRIGKMLGVRHDTVKGDPEMADELSDAMNKLHQELVEHPRLDASKIESLKALMADIQQVIDEQSSEQLGASDSGTLSSRIQDYVEEFEASYPKLTQTLSMIAERLADMGI
jgi:hypothetical protein